MRDRDREERRCTAQADLQPHLAPARDAYATSNSPSNGAADWPHWGGIRCHTRALRRFASFLGEAGSGSAGRDLLADAIRWAEHESGG